MKTATNIHPSAQKALYAVQLRRTSGAWSARRYAARHNVLGLYRLACQLEAVQSFNCEVK